MEIFIFTIVNLGRMNWESILSYVSTVITIVLITVYVCFFFSLTIYWSYYSRGFAIDQEIKITEYRKTKT